MTLIEDSKAGMSHNHNPVTIDPDGRAKYRVSALYQCTSALLAWRLGLQGGSAPEWMQERFDQGHVFEPIILDRAQTRGITKLYATQDETRQDIGNLARIVGHIDGLALCGDDGITVDSLDGVEGLTTFHWEGPAVIDAKAFARSTYDNWARGKWSAMPYYAWSMTAYSHFYGNIPILMACGLKDMDAVNAGEYVLSDFRLDAWSKPPIAWGEIVAKVLKVEALAKQGMDGMPGECSISQYPCPFWSFPFHTRVIKSRIEDGQIVGGLEEIARLAEQRAAASERMAAAKAEVDDLDLQMKALVGNQEGNAPISGLADGLSSVSFYYATTTGTDWAGIKKDYPEFEKDRYVTKGKSPRLSVKLNAKRPIAPPNVSALVD